MITRLLAPAQIQVAIDLLKNGEVIALPTETVYGLAADASNESALQKIFQAKNRPQDHPLIVHINGSEQLDRWVKKVPKEVYILAEKFWPGPLTMLFRKAAHVSSVVTAGLETIALRVPANNLFREILTKTKFGLAAPSANSHKAISPTQASHVLADLGGKIPAVLDGGNCEVGIESTILDVSSSNIKILRPGFITKMDIENVLGKEVIQPAEFSERVAGNMKKHYQPKTPAVLLEKTEIPTFLANSQNKSVLVLSFSELSFEEYNAEVIPMPEERNSYMRKIYKKLHLADQKGVDKIIIEKPGIQGEDWSAILDRLRKATS